MTPEQFTEALESLNWKQSDFCRMADVSKNTPQRWLNGVTPIPGWVVKFLAMAQGIKRLGVMIEPPKIGHPRNASTSKSFRKNFAPIYF